MHGIFERLATSAKRRVIPQFTLQRAFSSNTHLSVNLYSKQPSNKDTVVYEVTSTTPGSNRESMLSTLEKCQNVRAQLKDVGVKTYPIQTCAFGNSRGAYVIESRFQFEREIPSTSSTSAQQADNSSGEAAKGPNKKPSL